MQAPLVVVTGVSGSGKSVVGQALADRLGVTYADGDDFHSPANVAKMRAGEPLSDEDRRPWLDAIGRWLHAHTGSGAVASCSALRRAHRAQLLRAAPGAIFLHLNADTDVLRERLRQREDHFMPEPLLDTQLATLEPLGADEPGTTLAAEAPPDALVRDFLRWSRSIPR